jgi:hypothetical protein
MTWLRAAIGGWVLLAAAPLPAAPPELKALHPSGGQVGTEFEVEAVGKFAKETWPPAVWTSRPGVAFTPTESPGRFRVRIAPDTPPGPLLVRLHAPDGPSPCRIFVVGPLPEVLENPDNDAPASTQAVLASLPVVVNGRFEKGDDVDVFRLPGLQAGQTVSARVTSYGLLAPNDPFLHLLDPRGHEIAFGSVTHNLDPQLEHVLAENGDHFLQINALEAKATANVSFVGGTDRVYRIEVRDAPLPPPPLPGAVGGEGDPLTSAGRLEGCLAAPGETDRFPFPAKKGETWIVRAEARLLHLPTDPVLRILRPDGSEHAKADDTGPRPDAELTFKPAVDGTHTVEISDRYRRGGAAFRYHLLAAAPAPSCDVLASADAFSVKAGAETELALTLTRLHGHAAPLRLEATGLPPGVSLAPADLPPKSGPATAKLVAAPDAAAWTGPFRLTVREEGAAAPILVRATFQTGDSRGDYLVNEHPDLWLTVTPAAKP